MSLTADPQPTAADSDSLFSWEAHYRCHGRPIVGDDVVHWLLTDGHRTKDNAELADKYCWRLIGEGIPLWRATLSLSTLHPQFLGYGLRWWRDREFVEEVHIRHGAGLSSDYLDSPMRPAMERGETVRYRLDEPAAARFPLLVALRAAGGTDYLACPLTFLGRRHQVVTWTTDRPGGFTDAHVAEIKKSLPALGVVVEAKAMRKVMANVLDTYLGRTIGRHILNGEIRRSEGQHVRGMLLATDLRGFTALSDRLPSGELIALLDEYFDAVTSPIEAHGGEVLKFVGDGVLAFFELGAAAERDTARAALAAAEEALARLEAINLQRLDANQPAIRIGVGLHVGTVTYGNVGAADRLDFTVIGPAVNLACRLESLTKRLDRPLVMSHEFAKICALPLVSLGFHPVRGLSEPEEVFGLPARE
ncbi:MAG TPA: adenylate/guanylate cyclase domain-containing protein [Stellaceae bacterium]|nr:adenylate/guanylate cyclase domain-containing protein [Stellaceae bacterium]